MNVTTRENLIGQKFHRWTVLGFSHTGKWRTNYWKCVCDCGNKARVAVGTLRAGQSKSCGCLRKEVVGDLRRTHGRSKTTEYEIYTAMIQRCYNPKNIAYKYYGERGISVCDRWLESFENFFSDMGLRPEGKTLDRQQVNGNYEPSNCQWSTGQEQAVNKRKVGNLESFSTEELIAEILRRL